FLWVVKKKVMTPMRPPCQDVTPQGTMTLASRRNTNNLSKMPQQRLDCPFPYLEHCSKQKVIGILMHSQLMQMVSDNSRPKRGLTTVRAKIHLIPRLVSPQRDAI